MINEFLAEYEAKRQKILNNEDLAPEGKNKALAKHESIFKEEARKVARDLRKNAIIAAAVLKEAQDTKERLRDEALKNLDYNRLNYEASAVRSKIAASTTIFDAIAAWDQDQEKGDPYVIKAWKDQAAGPLVEKFEDGITEDKAKLFQSIAKAPVKLVDDSEIQEIERQSVDQLEDLEKQAATLGQKLINKSYSSNDQSLINRVMDGIKFKKGRILLDFEPRVVGKYEDGYEVMESHEQLAKRVEKEYQEKAQEYVKWAKENFDIDFDPDFSNLSGGI